MLGRAGGRHYGSKVPKAGQPLGGARASGTPAWRSVLVRDLIDQQSFDVLFGPWREIMHH
jgi:hypothetical protein